MITIGLVNILPNATKNVIVRRLYKRGVLTWKGIIREQLHARFIETLHIIPSQVRVSHDGYYPGMVDLHGIIIRNMRPLRKVIEVDPGNYAYFYVLARDYTLMNEYEAAIPYLNALMDSNQDKLEAYTIDEARVMFKRCMDMANK